MKMKCTFCNATEPNSHQFGCVGYLKEVDEEKEKEDRLKVYEESRIFSKEECEKQIDRMRLVSASFYGDATRCGNHQFIEFCGLMNKYIDMFTRTVNEGADPNVCNTHLGLPMLGVEAHDMKYLAEKFDCIFGPTLRDPKLRSAFISGMEWVDVETSDLKEELMYLKKYADPKDVAFVEGHLTAMRNKRNEF